MIRTPLEHGVEPRVEIDIPWQAIYSRKMGVRHFYMRDEFRALFGARNGPCREVNNYIKDL